MRAGHIFINGYSMAVSPFDRLRSGRSRNDEKLMCSTASPIITQKPTVASQKKAALRARDSVRRASDFVQIAIALTDPIVSVIACGFQGTAPDAERLVTRPGVQWERARSPVVWLGV